MSGTGWRPGGGVRGRAESGFRKQGPDLAADVPDRGPTHVAQRIDKDVLGAQSPQVEDGGHAPLSITNFSGKEPSRLPCRRSMPWR